LITIMTIHLSHPNGRSRLVVVHGPEHQHDYVTFTRALYEQPRGLNLHIIPLCQGARLLGLRPTINNFMLSHADAVVFLSPPRDLEQLELLRLAKSAQARERTMIFEASERREGGLQRFANRLLDRLFPLPIREVLCMFACAVEHDQLALHREWRAITDVNNQVGKPLALDVCWAARIHDLQDALLERPRDVLHFAGHGEPGGVYFESADGHAHSVATPRLIEVLAEHRPKCLVFNACHSADVLTKVPSRVPHVIAMNGPTSDCAAIEFSRAFYAALAHGRTVVHAFDHAFEGVGLHGYTEQCRPRLLN
jgi:hypothetical protein